MKIAVLSGKGGTGKTLVSVNLACVAGKASFVDCDVEEPNGHLFLKPDITCRDDVMVRVPEVDRQLCTGCRKCVDFCKYNALALIRDKLMLFNEVCHSCGGCILFCPSGALHEKEKTIGSIEEGLSEEVRVLTGCLNTGEASGAPIIKELMERLPEEEKVIIDCPPGSACVVMESIQDADYCVIVAEPTLFGVHNMAMVCDLLRLFNKPFGVVLNKCLSEHNPAEAFCLDHQLNILTRIDFDETLGSLNAKGKIAVRESRKYRELFQALLAAIEKEAVT